MIYRSFLLGLGLIAGLQADEEKDGDKLEKLAEKVRASIAVISTADREGVRSGTGTGICC